MEGKPKVIVFCCNWSVKPGLRLSKLSSNEKDDKSIVAMCCGRVGPDLILEAFSKGAWGVMLAGCPPEECEHDGNYKAQRRFFMLRNMLDQFNIEPERLSLEWFSTGEADKLKKSVDAFTEKIAELGPIQFAK